MLTAAASEIVEIDQPNSSCNGSISTPGTARNPAAPTSARKVTAAAHHAGWMRYTRCVRIAALASVTAASIAARRSGGKGPDGHETERPGHATLDVPAGLPARRECT